MSAQLRFARRAYAFGQDHPESNPDRRDRINRRYQEDNGIRQHLRYQSGSSFNRQLYKIGAPRDVTRQSRESYLT